LGLATGLPSQALLRQVALLPLALASSKMTRGLLMALSYGRLLAACWFVVGLFAPNVALAFWESLQADACKSKFFTEQVHLEYLAATFVQQLAASSCHERREFVGLSVGHGWYVGLLVGHGLFVGLLIGRGLFACFLVGHGLFCWALLGSLVYPTRLLWSSYMRLAAGS